MKRNVVLLAVLCGLGVAIAQIAGAQAKHPNVAGTWTVMLSPSGTTRAGDAPADTKQMWTLTQAGDKVMGKITEDANAGLTITCTWDGASGDVLRAKITKDGTDDVWYAETTVVGDGMSGTMRTYKTKEERLLIAKRAK